MHLRTSHAQAELLCKLYITIGERFQVQSRLAEDPMTTMTVPDKTYDRLRKFVVDHDIKVEILGLPPGVVLRDPR